MLKTKPLSEDHGELHEFTVSFWKDRVMIENQTFPLGELTTQILNTDPDVFVRIHNLCATVLPKIRHQLFNDQMAKDYFLLSEIQKSVNAVLDELRKLPVYNILQINERNTYHLLPAMWQNQKEFQRAMLHDTPENQMLGQYYERLFAVPDELLVFHRYIFSLLDYYFEKLSRRNAEHYAAGIYTFLSDETAQKMLADSLPGMEISPFFQFRMAQESMIEYTTMPNPDNKKEYVIAERLVFHSLAAFLYSDFYRGLMQGSAPRRCHNCRRYFLLENGYNTCYCNRIAPGEANRTCRQIGAHKKEASPQGKTPARLEYDKAYNRLKTQKARGKISLDEWNQRVAKAQEIKDRAERGELSDREMREELGKI